MAAVEQPSILKTAKAINYTVPTGLVLRADEVLEELLMSAIGAKAEIAQTSRNVAY